MHESLKPNQSLSNTQPYLSIITLITSPYFHLFSFTLGRIYANIIFIIPSSSASSIFTPPLIPLHTPSLLFQWLPFPFSLHSLPWNKSINLYLSNLSYALALPFPFKGSQRVVQYQVLLAQLLSFMVEELGLTIEKGKLRFLNLVLMKVLLVVVVMVMLVKEIGLRFCLHCFLLLLLLLLLLLFLNLPLLLGGVPYYNLHVFWFWFWFLLFIN